MEGRLDAAETDSRLALSLARSAQGSIPYSDRTGLQSLMLGRVLESAVIARSREAFHAAVGNLSSTVDPGHPELVPARQFASGG